MKKDNIVSGFSIETKRDLLNEKLFELSAGYQHQYENEEVELDIDQLEHVFELAFFLENIIFRCSCTDFADAHERLNELERTLTLKPKP